MIDNSEFATSFSSLSKDLVDGVVTESAFTVSLLALLDQWNQQVSVGGLAARVTELNERYDRKWSAFLDLDVKGVLSVIADLPVSGNDNGDLYWVVEATTGYPSGQAYVWLDSLWVPQGADFTKGKTGPAGPAGQNAYERAVVNGFVGTEAAWLASINGTGISAYEEAVALGFVGTNEQWIASLQGEDGFAPWTTVTAWAATTAYSATAPASVVVVNGGTYLCVTSHTSGVFATDLAAGKWQALALKGSVGDTGPVGANVATVFLFSRASSAPSVPSTTLTFTFATGVLSGTLGDWTQTVPTGTDPIYVTTAVASAVGLTDTIATGEWSTPRVLAQNGTNGGTGPAAPCVVTCVVTPATGVDSTVVVGDGVGFVPIPASYNGKNLTAVIATVTTVSSSGALTIQLRRSRGSVDMLSTPITVAAGQNASTGGGATQPVINTANDDVATGDLVFIDVDAAGTGATGLAVTATYG